MGKAPGIIIKSDERRRNEERLIESIRRPGVRVTKEQREAAEVIARRTEEVISSNKR